MNKYIKAAFAALLMTATAVPAVTVTATPAVAEDVRNGDWLRNSPNSPYNSRYYRHRGDRHYRHGRVVRRHRDGDAAAAAIIGFATGAVIGGILSESRRNDRVYVAPRDYRVYRGPKVITLDQGSLEPWTASWYRYCDARYRSFNPNTGTYRGYDGQDHFCVAR